jgi:hypothetical protein
VSSPGPPQAPAATAASVAAVRHVQACLQHLAHLLPAQAPLRDFVHHNTLHAFQHLPFTDALKEASRLSGARPWLDENRCRELFRQGRMDAGDLDAALRQTAQTRVDELLGVGTPIALRRGDVLRAALLTPPAAISATRLRWQREEKGAFERLQADLEPGARQRLLSTAAADGDDERAAVADLWAAACALGARPPVSGWVRRRRRRDAGICRRPLARVARPCGRRMDGGELALPPDRRGFSPVAAAGADPSSRRASRSGPRRLEKPGAVAGFLRGLASVCR